MKTVSEHSRSNVLVIPQALFAMKDVRVIKHWRNSAIFYKNLEQDLVDIEFYTNTPCFIYISKGMEILTNGENETIVLGPGSSLFLPQGSKLQSDFVRKTESLEAYLVFFDDDVITEFLTKVGALRGGDLDDVDYCYLKASGELAAFFTSIRGEITTQSYLNVKLEELLHLINWKAGGPAFHSLLLTRKRIPPRQNLARLLETLDTYHLSVGDLAHLSGRSLSSFYRDFKAVYQMPPKRWLLERKLSKARELLLGREMSVTDVALTMGYDNVSAFIKAFSKRYGVTPSKIMSAE